MVEATEATENFDFNTLTEMDDEQLARELARNEPKKNPNEKRTGGIKNPLCAESQSREAASNEPQELESHSN